MAAKFSQSYCDIGMGPCCLRMSARALKTDKHTANKCEHYTKKEAFPLCTGCLCACIWTQLKTRRGLLKQCCAIMGNSGLLRFLFFCLSLSFLFFLFLTRLGTWRMFICKRNSVGCVSISANWVEFECFSDRTRCMWKDEALEGGERGREAIMMKESKKNVCLLFFWHHT